MKDQKTLRVSSTSLLSTHYVRIRHVRMERNERGGGRNKAEGRIIAQVVEISPHSLDGQRDGLRFKSYMRDVMSGKFRDVIH